MSPEFVEWSYNPWRERPGRALGGCLAAAAFCGLIVLYLIGFFTIRKMVDLKV